MPNETYSFVDLFSGAGGMSFGFAAHEAFDVLGAADGEIGKPSTGFGAIDCNSTYHANIGLEPVAVDLGQVRPDELLKLWRPRLGSRPIQVLSACPPCTGFSRTNARNHQVDDSRNSLVTRVADFAEAWKPLVIVMENARELITGKFAHHYEALVARLRAAGYDVRGDVHLLSRFGLPQYRERALVVASRVGRALTLDDLWEGREVAHQATNVRRAIGDLPPVESGVPLASDPMHVATSISSDVGRRRLAAIPPDGGSWLDLAKRADADELLIPSMKKQIERGTTNHFCDVYGRMRWDSPAPTIKRECCHVGNGRYAHPEQNRLCTMREMAIIQGFPSHYTFTARSRKNNYRHIGDAVPPLISYQLAHVVAWMLTGVRPRLESVLLPDTHMKASDLVAATRGQLRLFGNLYPTASGISHSP